tara:strand:+ start:165 stop:767 length:603 start_codon:yes stop_codon:yes gene_type:complete
LLVKALKVLWDLFKLGTFGKLVVLLMTFLITLFAWVGLWAIFLDDGIPSAQEEKISQHIKQRTIEDCLEAKSDPEDERYKDVECDEIDELMDEESEPGKNKLWISGIFGVAIISSLVSLVLIIHLLDVLIGIIVFAMSSVASYFLIRLVLGIFVEITSTMTTITLIFSIIFGVILGLVSHMFVFDWIASKTKLSIFLKFR